MKPEFVIAKHLWNSQVTLQFLRFNIQSLLCKYSCIIRLQTVLKPVRIVTLTMVSYCLICGWKRY